MLNTSKKKKSTTRRLRVWPTGLDGYWTAWQCRLLYWWMGPVWNRMCCMLSERTVILLFLIPISSSISLTAGESENSGAKHNTMTGYWQWPYGAIISSFGYLISPRESLDCHSTMARKRDAQIKLSIQSSATPLCKYIATSRHNALLHLRDVNTDFA